MKFNEISAAVIDMDGVLWRGNEALPGIVELFEWLDEAQIPYVLATNNSSRTPGEYLVKLSSMGVVGVPENRIINSSIATAAYMQTNYMRGTEVSILGMHGLHQALEDAGFFVIEEGSPQVSVVGIDFDLTYEKLRRVVQHILAGAEFIGTNPDKTFPAANGLVVPGAGSLIAAVQAATGKEPIVVGKPELPMFQVALEWMNVPAERTLMIGDRLDTDILGAQKAGMKTALVFTGVTTPDDLATQEIWPDVAYESLPQLLSAWAGDAWYREKLKAKRVK